MDNILERYGRIKKIEIIDMETSRISHLYKYVTINQNFYNSIINNELYFANPRIFNDPFDSNPRFSIIKEKEKVKRLFAEVRNLININYSKIREDKDIKGTKQFYEFLVEKFTDSMIFDFFNDTESKNMGRRLMETHTFYNSANVFKKTFEISPEKLQQKIFTDLVFLLIEAKRLGISCGSATPTCPVMWGHYASNHQGVCLEFKLLDENSNHQFCLSSEDSVDISVVNYSDNPLESFGDEHLSLDKLSHDILTTKSITWNYEKEIRLLHKNQGLLKFNKRSLTKIIFGCKTNSKDRYSICRLLSNLGYDAEFLKATMQPDNYEMKIEPMALKDIAGSGVHLSELNIDYPDFLKNLM